MRLLTILLSLAILIAAASIASAQHWANETPSPGPTRYIFIEVPTPVEVLVEIPVEVPVEVRVEVPVPIEVVRTVTQVQTVTRDLNCTLEKKAAYETLRASLIRGYESHYHAAIYIDNNPEAVNWAVGTAARQREFAAMYQTDRLAPAAVLVSGCGW